MTQKCRISLLKTVACLVLFTGLSIQAQADGNKVTSSKKLRSMARIFMTYGDYEKARGLAEQAYSMAKEGDIESNEMALCMIDLGTVYSNLEMLNDADRLFKSGIDLQKEALFEKHPYVAHTYRMLSDVQRRAGDLEQAEQSLEKAVEIMLDNCDLQSIEMSPFILESAKLYDAKGQYDKAEKNFQMALDMIEGTYGVNHLMTANVLEAMSKCYFVQHKYDQADNCISTAITIQNKLFGRFNLQMIDAWLSKARICRAKGQIDRSDYYLSKVTASVENNRNAITLAKVYEQVNQVRNDKLYAAAVNLD